MTPGAVIWKILPTPGGILFGESRDPEGKTMSLFALRPGTGEKIFSGVQLDEPWWIALEMTVGEVAILHRFPKPDLPNAMGTVAVDTTNGAILWSNDQLRILCGVEELAIAQQGDSLDWSNLLLIDARSGIRLEEIGEDPARVAGFQLACEGSAQWSGWINGDELNEGDARFAEINGRLDVLGKERRGTIEFAEHGGYQIVACHRRSTRSATSMLSNLYDTELFVFDGERTLYRETIMRDASGVGSEIFFILNGVLMFIRDRRTLVGINLNGE